MLDLVLKVGLHKRICTVDICRPIPFEVAQPPYRSVLLSPGIFISALPVDLPPVTRQAACALACSLLRSSQRKARRRRPRWGAWTREPPTPRSGARLEFTNR